MTLLKTMFPWSSQQRKACVLFAEKCTTLLLNSNIRNVSHNFKTTSMAWIHLRNFQTDLEAAHRQSKDKEVHQPIINKLVRLMDCKKQQAQEIYAQIPNSETLHPKSIEAKIGNFRQHGLNFDALMLYPWLWTLSPKDLHERVEIMNTIGLNSDTVPLLKLGTRQLTKVVQVWISDSENVKVDDFSNRMQFFTYHLQCSMPEFAKCLHLHSTLLTLDWHRLSRIMHMMLDGGITPEQIMNDLWIFRHNEEVMKIRLERAGEAGVLQIKTWMLRCPESVFANALEKWHNEKDVLGSHKDTASYLAERLQCSKEDISDLVKRFPRLLCINLPKLKLALDFLFSKGFTPTHVWQTPRVLAHSILTLQHRLQELNSLGYYPRYLPVLFCTATRYESLIEKLQKAKRTAL